MRNRNLKGVISNELMTPDSCRKTSLHAVDVISPLCVCPVCFTFVVIFLFIDIKACCRCVSFTVCSFCSHADTV